MRELGLLIKQIVQLVGIAAQVVDLDHMSPPILDRLEIVGAEKRAHESSLSHQRTLQVIHLTFMSGNKLSPMCSGGTARPNSCSTVGPISMWPTGSMIRLRLQIRSPDDQGYVDHLLVESLAVEIGTVLAESLSVVAREMR